MDPYLEGITPRFLTFFISVAKFNYFRLAYRKESILRRDRVTSEDEIFFQLALSQVENIGAITARKLIRHFGSAKELFRLGFRDLLQVSGMTSQRARNIAEFNNLDRISEEFEFASKRGVEIISFMDPGFPQRLNHCPDSPLVLFKKGEGDLNATRMVSVVGTRKISDYGKIITKELIAGFKPYNITVVSGMAYGVDICSHKACLNIGLPTIAVMGHGLDRIYPNSHTRYAKEMLEQGAILSEFTSGTQPDRENFPKRNRIVAGMTDATIVVESGYKGGSVITADLAMGYNRDVFAIPGRVSDPASEGCNQLIKTNRAALLESVKDLEYIMGWKVKDEHKEIQKRIFVDLKPEEEKLLSYLKEEGRSQIDEISLSTKLPMSLVMTHLLNLELNGLVRAIPGKNYEIC